MPVEIIKRQETKAGYKTAAIHTYTKYNHRWAQISLRIRKQNPICTYCGMLSQEVDHLDGNVNNNQYNNLIALCKLCHGYKTALFEFVGKSVTDGLIDFVSNGNENLSKLKNIVLHGKFEQYPSQTLTALKFVKYQLQQCATYNVKSRELK